MSYCRWSSMDWTCDLYVCEATDGIAIHVAAGAYKGIPKVTAIMSRNTMEEYFKQVHEKFTSLKTAKVVPYTGREHAGGSYYGLDHQSAIDFLVALKELGYVFPESVIMDLEEEINND